MNKKNTTLLSLVLFLGVVVVLNMLSSRFFVRLDLTSDSRYTLSDATKNLLSELDEPVTVTACFSEDLPPEVGKVRQEFLELLIEYTNRSHGNVAYEFVNPSKDDASERQAMQKGIQPVIITQREKDKAVQKKAYLGAIVSYGDENEVLPVIQSGSAMEYALSTAIKKLIATDKPVIGLLQGAGMATQSSLAQSWQQLSVLYDVQTVNLTDSTNLEMYKTLMLVRPTDSIPQNHLAMLDAYLQNGGNLLVAFDRVEADFQSAMGRGKTTGLESWLATKGVNVAEAMITDASCGAITVQQDNGFIRFNTQVQFPYLPIANNFEEHPVTAGLEAVVFQFASPIYFSGDSTINYVPLVRAGKKCNTVPMPTYFDINRQWTDRDFPLSDLAIGAMVEGKMGGRETARMIVFSDGEFALNNERQGQINPDNLNLFVNAVDWLSDDTGLIELRTKGVTARMLDQLEDGRKAFLKWFNFLLPVVLVVIYGMFRYQKNRILRIKRMEEDYV